MRWSYWVRSCWALPMGVYQGGDQPFGLAVERDCQYSHEERADGNRRGSTDRNRDQQMMGLKKIRAGNFLPAMAIAPFIVYMMGLVMNWKSGKEPLARLSRTDGTSGFGE